MTRYKHFLSVLLALSGSLTASAQGRVMTLEECLDSAMSRNMTVKSGRIAVERAKDLQGTAFDLDPTGLSLSQDPTSGGSPDNAITLSQTFALPMVYASRRKQLRAQTDVEKGRLEVTRNELAKAVTSAYCTLLYMYERMNILEAQDSIYQDFCRVAEAKYKAGETGALERMNAKRMGKENALAKESAKSDYRSAQLQLMNWMNTSTPVVPDLSGTHKLPAPTLSDGFNASLSPVGMLTESELKASEQSLKATRSEALPTVSLAASMQMVLKGFNPYNVDRSSFAGGDFMGFEVGVNIPLSFGSNRAKTRAARKEVEIAGMERESALKTLETQYQTAVNDFVKAKETLRYYEEEGLSEAAEMTRISRASYENGSIGYVELMQNLQTAMDIRMSYASAVNDYNQTVATLNSIKGYNK